MQLIFSCNGDETATHLSTRDITHITSDEETSKY